VFFKNPHCATSGNNSRAKLFENNSRMYICNYARKDYVTILIDGCDISHGQKCDIGVYLVSSEERLLVELKGSDIKHAASQLQETLIHYALKKTAGVKCFIISSNNPMSSTAAQSLKLTFRKSNGVPLFIEKTGFEYSYS
jgi:hypothetical protein